jgi:hypothetical protein
MSSSFPEHSDRGQADVLFQLLDSILLPQSCAYVAGPLGTGKNYYERLAAGDQHPTVRPENELRLCSFVGVLRERLPYPVFDPGRLRISDWVGRDYDAFFLEVIRRYAKDCWFLSGWEYSTGATKEFVFCAKSGIRCFDEASRTLTISDGIALIQAAADSISAMRLDRSKLESRVADLRRLEI